MLAIDIDRSDPAEDVATGQHVNAADTPETFPFTRTYAKGTTYGAIRQDVVDYLIAQGRTVDQPDPAEFMLGQPYVYTAHARVKKADGVQFTSIAVNRLVTLESVAVSIHVLPGSGVSLEAALYADVGGKPGGSKLATTGILAVGDLAEGRNVLAFGSSYVVDSPVLWLGVSNLDSGNLELATTFGSVRGMCPGMVYFDKVAAGPGQDDPVVPGNLVEGDEAVIFVAALGS